jgi:hypothetical protein
VRSKSRLTPKRLRFYQNGPLQPTRQKTLSLWERILCVILPGNMRGHFTSTT